ncbi:prepilin peptidase [Paenibacillus sp. 1P07SE]|uniref:A24 family peptidase n=1 Tax=Paenibacillus sp. 1P07SE TaxID=3132209 RepID=UPI0039A57FFE
MMMTITGTAALLIVAAALFTDVRAMIIPNRLTLTACLAGLLYQGVMGGWGGLAEALLGTAAGFGPLLILYLLKGVGAGDVKLFGALGAWLGPAAVLQVLCYSILFAGLIGVIILVIHRPFFYRCVDVLRSWFRLGGTSGTMDGSEAKQRLRFPFMLAVAPAALIYFLI